MGKRPFVRYMYKTFAKRMMNHKRIERLFRANYSRMFRLAVALLHDEDEARDAASEVFARLLDGRSSLPAGSTSQSDGQLAGWLLVCTRNRCLDLLSRRQVRERGGAAACRRHGAATVARRADGSALRGREPLRRNAAHAANPCRLHAPLSPGPLLQSYFRATQYQ